MHWVQIVMLQMNFIKKVSFVSILALFLVTSPVFAATSPDLGQAILLASSRVVMLTLPAAQPSTGSIRLHYTTSGFALNEWYNPRSRYRLQPSRDWSECRTVVLNSQPCTTTFAPGPVDLWNWYNTRRSRRLCTRCLLHRRHSLDRWR